MAEPRLSFVRRGIHAVERRDYFRHVAGGVDPTLVHIRKIDRAIRALLFAGEANRAPEGLHIA